jgi:predicted porin
MKNPLGLAAMAGRRRQRAAQSNVQVYGLLDVGMETANNQTQPAAA